LKKATSGNKKDILESLDLFENNWNDLPSGSARAFIYNMMENADNEIKQKAEEVYSKTLKESDEILKTGIESITKSFKQNLLPIQKQMKDLSRAFTVSKEMVNIVKSIPRVSILDERSVKHLVELNKSLNGLAKPIINSQITAIPLNVEPSPILRAENLFSGLSDEASNLHKPFNEFLAGTEEEINADIDFISSHNYDFNFNYLAYKLLCNLEIYLRYLIQETIIEPNSGNLQTKIPNAILKKWEDRRQSEESNPIVDGGYDLIYYSDFTDIKEILQKGKNFKLFEDIFSQEQFKTVISKLHELDPIRKKIAHYRPLSENEFDRLRIYSNDILPS
jgi:hypothetical protein